MTLKKVIDNYYWIFVFLGIFSFLGGKALGGIVMLLIGLCAVYYYVKRPFKWNAFDSLFVLFMVYQVVSVSFSHYPRALYVAGIKAQIVPMLFYLLGRNMIFSDNKLMENMKTPMMLAFVAGILLFFWSPSWYTNMRMAKMAANDVTDGQGYNALIRLSLPGRGYYDAGYGAVIFLMFYLKRFLGPERGLMSYACIAAAMICLLFSQLRVCIAFMGVYLIIFTVFSKGQERKTLVFIWMAVAVCLIGALFFLFNYADGELLDFINKRIFEEDDNIVDQRFEQFSSYYRTPLLGDGLGRYGHAAWGLTHKSIPDCEYIRVMNELGIVGWVIFGAFYVKIMLRSFFNIRFFLFEFSMFSFFLAAMIGATPLENASMQPFLFWYCAGRVANSTLLKRMKLEQAQGGTSLVA